MHWAPPLEFSFICRPKGKHNCRPVCHKRTHDPTEFLEQVNIVRDPPPLFSFDWDQLDKDERKDAFTKLQDVVMRRAQGFGVVVRDPVNDPWEWEHWARLKPDQRKNAFKKLQVSSN